MLDSKSVLVLHSGKNCCECIGTVYFRQVGQIIQMWIYTSASKGWYMFEYLSECACCKLSTDLQKLQITS